MNTWIHELIVPLKYAFMWHALAMGIFTGAACAILSCYIILKGWALMGDAISHSILPGVVIAYILGLPLAVGAFCTGLLCAVGTGIVRSHSRIREDTVMGVIFTGLFAIGLVIFSKTESDQHLNHILFGNLLGIPKSESIQALAICGIAFVLIALKGKDLLLYCFDPGHAQNIGLNTTVLQYTLLVLLSLTIVASLQVVGVVLCVAMLVAPGATAFLISDNFLRMKYIAVASAVFSNIFGIYLSFFLDASTGGCIVLTQTFVFVLALIFAPKRGLLAQRRVAKHVLQHRS